MPMYSARCEVCGKNQTYFQTVANRASTPLCCAAPTTKMLDTPMVSANVWTDHKGFTAHGRDGQGVWIGSGTEYNKFLQKNDFIPESEGKREAEIKSAGREAAEDAKLTKAVEVAVHQHNL